MIGDRRQHLINQSIRHAAKDRVRGMIGLLSKATTQKSVELMNGVGADHSLIEQSTDQRTFRHRVSDTAQQVWLID